MKTRKINAVGDKLVPVLFKDEIKRYPKTVVHQRYCGKIFLITERGILAYIDNIYQQYPVTVSREKTTSEKRKIKDFIYQYWKIDEFNKNDTINNERWTESDYLINDYMVCPECGRVVAMNNTSPIGGGFRACRSCIRDSGRFEYCGSCGVYHYKEDFIDFKIVNRLGYENRRFCKECFESFKNRVVYCEDCGAYASEGFAVYDDDGVLRCVHCSHDWDVCGGCGAMRKLIDLTEKDGVLFCPSCLAREKELTTIHPDGEDNPLFEDNNRQLRYHYRDDYWNRRFYCDKGYTLKPLNIAGPYMGVELELDSETYSDRDIYVEKVLSFASGLGHFEEDGSLEEGAEWVQEPITLGYARKSETIAELFDVAADYMYASWRDGMHIHVGRDYFGDKTNQLKSIGILAYWLYNFQDEFFDISGRDEKSGSYHGTRYMQLYPDDSQSELEDKLSEYNNGDRYVNLNLCNSSTIEFRFFGSTVCYDGFIRKLTVIDTICRKAKAYTIAHACAVNSFRELLDRTEFKKEVM